MLDTDEGAEGRHRRRERKPTFLWLVDAPRRYVTGSLDS
ncbi:MAG: hypothetical protein QOH45_2842 [Pseudonocardiales bacterium]|jgi:hypothetical protein|nr:hypothetical protein [Pseudonocardiales bacterium]MDT7626487.1 hypothetical protein [Pseudonocardiales bacterium]